jgi:hypothetical protein
MKEMYMESSSDEVSGIIKSYSRFQFFPWRSTKLFNREQQALTIVTAATPIIFQTACSLPRR